MWRKLVSILLLVYSVVGEFSTADFSIQCPAITNQENERMYPPRFRGVWTSTRCETRSGPEFLLRKYIFRRRKFKLYQFYYFDPNCNRPKYSIVAEGKVKIQQMSWVVQGGAEADYRVDNVTITPYNKHFARKLNKKIKLNCKTLYGINVKRYKQYKIFNFPRYNKGKYKKFKDYDCLNMLSLSFHELQLIKVELNRQAKPTAFALHKSYMYSNRPSKTRKTTRLLYLGNIHTDKTQRISYRPTSYQTPLIKGNSRTCPVCRKVKKANESKPPRLPKSRKHDKKIIDGYWTSTNCETRSYGQFVKRSLIFHPNGVSWEGEYDFFRDPDCKLGSLSVFVSGDYIKERESRVITGASDYTFNITQMSMTPRDLFTTDTLNHAQNHTCGIRGSWKRDTKQSILNTNGCSILGLHVPTTEYEIIKIETRELDDLLLVGIRPTDGKTLSGPSARPTSFQPPLIRCMVERTNNELPYFV